MKNTNMNNKNAIKKTINKTVPSGISFFSNDNKFRCFFL